MAPKHPLKFCHLYHSFKYSNLVTHTPLHPHNKTELNKTVRATCHQRRRTSLGRSFLREQSSPQICLWRSRSPCRTRVVIHHHPGALEKGKHTAKLNILVHSHRRVCSQILPARSLSSRRAPCLPPGGEHLPSVLRLHQQYQLICYVHVVNRWGLQQRDLNRFQTRKHKRAGILLGTTSYSQ